MKKNTAHNEMEVRALIEEAFQRGDADMFNGIHWFKHDSEELLCISRITLIGYFLDFKNYTNFKEL